MAKRGKLPSVQTIVESNVVTNQLASAMATGSWVGGRTGVSQRLERSNYARTISHLRNSISPLTTTQEHFEARELHATHFGRFCPAETPEGPTIGLRKYLALFAKITNELPEPEKKKILNAIKVDNNGTTNVYLDGIPLGTTSNPTELINSLREKRRTGKIANEVNFVYYPKLNEVRINTDAGRVRRPLVIVDNGVSRLTKEIKEKIANNEITWKDLLEQGIIEYVDAEEEDMLYVAMNEEDLTPEHTHLELLVEAILGLSASLVIFPEHNRGDRVNYGAKMVGQSIGIYQNNYPLRTDTKANVLVYPEKALITTDTSAPIGVDRHPAGQNVVIALLSYHGFNIEDGLVFNKASIERGLLRSFFYRIYTTKEKRYWGGQKDSIEIPQKDIKGYKTEDAYKMLDSDGIISPETAVNSDDVIVGRVSPLRFLSANELISGVSNTRETSTTIRHGEKGVIDRVFLTESANGDKVVKVSVRDLRIPELGDKFASRHGQKGVIGLIVNEEDMPFTSSGIIPDIIFNPHGIPSRQTIGQLLEILSGKTVSLTTKHINGSFYSKTKEDDIRRMLHEAGFRSDGKETMYNGITGEKFEIEIFTGVAYYQKLDHMVANKLQARSRGPVTLLTRQPTEGKAKEGGLRLGEMEKDCLIGHGAALVLKERFDSDKITVPVCKKCGIIANWDKRKDKYVCPICGESDIKNIDMSYAFKLMLDELKTMLIYPKLNVSG